MRGLLPFLALLLFCACSSIDSRVREHRKEFDAMPPEVQAKIKAGQVDLGFDQDMVYMALGRPSRAYERVSEVGTLEIWEYGGGSSEPTVGVGVGVGGYGPHGGGSVGVSRQSQPAPVRKSVTFRSGRVVSVEGLKPPGS